MNLGLRSKFNTAVCAVQVFGCIFLLGMGLSATAAEIGKGPDNPLMSQAASPYLQTHSKDLVRWREWGEEAFAEARRTGKPIMASFGYTACHWCHVMQETHFNDPVLAKMINDDYVPVLVDRERRPSLDEAYMLVTEALTQRGGWPNTVFMTPERKPFYGTGYVPTDLFHQILTAVTTGWTGDRATLIAEADEMSTLLTAYMTRKEAARAITPDVLATVTADLAKMFDPFAGGIGVAPKFFQQPVLIYLLQQVERTGDPAALEAVERTLLSVMSGGIHDHIEGGFHRYAVDQGWRIPHFEKMLYDQSLMAEAFTRAYQITGKPNYAATARKTLDYVLADLTAPEGGFYATRDADSEGEEGTYYVWTPEELTEVLGPDDGTFALEVFDTVADGEFAGRVILNMDNVEAGTQERIERIVQALGEARTLRPKPRRDEKIVASWNGMAIASLALASQVLEEPRYGVAAAKAGDFIWRSMRAPDGGLFRSYYADAGHVDGELEDFAQIARGYLYLFDLTADHKWLDRAKSLADLMVSRFEDPEAGDFYSTAGATGFGRIKPRSDVDQPSANAVALDVLARLSRRLPDPSYGRRAEKAVAALSGLALKAPAGGVSTLSAGDRLSRGETGQAQFAGNGAVRTLVSPTDEPGGLRLRVHVADGWHINADKPLEDHLIATGLSMTVNRQSVAAEIDYPAPLVKTLAFNKKPLALFEGGFEIVARLKDPDLAVGSATAALQVQACSDEICLLPETLRLQFAWPESD